MPEDPRTSPKNLLDALLSFTKLPQSRHWLLDGLPGTANNERKREAFADGQQLWCGKPWGTLIIDYKKRGIYPARISPRCEGIYQLPEANAWDLEGKIYEGLLALSG